MNQSQWILNTGQQTAIHLSLQPLALNSFVKSYNHQEGIKQSN